MVLLTKYTASQLSFYAKYHNNPINIWVHIIFVPMIYATAIILGGFIPSTTLSENIVIRASDVAATVYGVGYVLLDPLVGTLMVPFHIACAYYARSLPVQYPHETLKYAGSLQILSWVAQIISHQLAEGRAPAFFTNLFQSFYLAPLFVVLEIFFMFGYKPELKAKIDEEVKADKIARGKLKATNGVTNGGNEKAE